MVDGEEERVDISAGGAGVRMVKSIDAGCGVVCSVPGVLIASRNIVGSVIMLVDAEVQGVCAGTPVGVLVVVYVCARFVISLFVPSVAFAGLLGECIIGAVVDGEVECVYIGTSGVWLSVVEGIDTGSCVCHSVPCVLLTSCYVVGGIVMLVYT